MNLPEKFEPQLISVPKSDGRLPGKGFYISPEQEKINQIIEYLEYITKDLQQTNIGLALLVNKLDDQTN